MLSVALNKLQLVYQIVEMAAKSGSHFFSALIYKNYRVLLERVFIGSKNLSYRRFDHFRLACGFCVTSALAACEFLILAGLLAQTTALNYRKNQRQTR